jgi:ubiquinone/menaquinone biosynthesis C-methylase UbiE
MRKKSFGENKKSLLDKFIETIRCKKVMSKIPSNSIVLDLGCGFNAQLLSLIENKIKKGVGIDLSVNNNFKSNKISLINSRADTKLSFPNNSFDIVCALAVIEHVNNYKVLLSESFRVLKKGGLLLLTTPSQNSRPLLEFLANTLKVVDSDEILDHKQYFSTQILTKLLVDAGFDRKFIKIDKYAVGLVIFAQIQK